MDQCTYCDNKDEIDKCYKEECFMLESWIVKHLQFKLKHRETILEAIADHIKHYNLGIDK